jgi:hypothetical protein
MPLPFKNITKEFNCCEMQTAQIHQALSHLVVGPAYDLRIGSLFWLYISVSQPLREKRR